MKHKQKPKNAVFSEDHPRPIMLAPDACRACGGTGQIRRPKDCPRCEGDGRDRFYSIPDRPNV